MKIRFWIALCLFISSYFPLTIIWALLDFDFQRKNLSHPLWIAALNGLTLLSMVMSGLALYLPCRLKRITFQVKITAVQEKSADLLNYALPYIVAFYAATPGDYGTVAALTFFMIILFVLSYLRKIILMNPFVLLLGYQLYEVNCHPLGNRQIHQQLLWSKVNPIPTNSAVGLCQISDNFVILIDPNPEV